MKKLFFSILSVLLMAFMASCTSVNEHQVSAGQDSVRKIEPEFFYAITHNVINGDNTWDRAKYYFGSGYDWEYLVSINKFLQEPGRVWQDSVTGVWYALILPGEVLNIGCVFPIVTFNDTIKSQSQPNQVNQTKESAKSFSDFLAKMPWWGWLIGVMIVLFFMGLIGTIREESEKKKKFKHSDNPTKEGKPFVDGGVKPEDAGRHFLKLLQDNNPGSKISLKNVRNGFISTPDALPSIVKFADGTQQNLTFRNVPGHEGEVSIDGKPSVKEYFFDGCGNPVYNRRSMKSGLFFTTTPINFGGENQTSQTSSDNQAVEIVEIPEAKQVVEEQILPTTPTAVTLGSETHQQKMLILDIAKALAAREDIHELTIDGNAEALGLQAKFKFTPAVKKASEKPSADEKK